MSKRQPKYDDKYRASAVIMLEAQGYPTVKGALQAVSNHLKVPLTTLNRWYHGKNNPPPSELVTEKRIEFKDAIKQELQEILGAMPNAREDASYKDLATSFGIMLDKLQLLENKPTAISEHREGRSLPPLSDDTLEDILRHYDSGDTE
jgi:hypothetical protein